MRLFRLKSGGVFLCWGNGCFPQHNLKKTCFKKCVGVKMSGEMGENFPPHSGGCEFFLFPPVCWVPCGGNLLAVNHRLQAMLLL